MKARDNETDIALLLLSVSIAKDSVIRGKWVQLVRTHRHDFKELTYTFKLLCSVDFEVSCYERKKKKLTELSSMETQDLKTNCFLKEAAVPTRDYYYFE